MKSAKSVVPTDTDRLIGWTFVALQFAFFGCYAFVPAWQPLTPPAWGWRLPGLVLVAAGAALAIAGTWAIRGHITPLPHPPGHAELMTTGAFALARHPIYGGVLLAALGWAAWRCDLARTALSFALGVFFLVKSTYEESLLSERFPEAYPPYATRVKRMIPWLI